MPRKKVSKRGMGRIFRPTYQYNGKTIESKIWWMAYYRNGKEIRESTETDDRDKATERLRERLSDVHHDRPSGPGIDKTTYEDLERLIVDDYTLNERDLRVLNTCRLPPLRAVFEGMLARDIDEKAITRYKAGRRRQHPIIGGKWPRPDKTRRISVGTINREMTTLKRMFTLGVQNRMVGRMPHIEMLDENNARQGFLERADVDTAKSHVDDESIKNLIEVAYITGWRFDAELLERKWSDIDFNANELRLWVGEGKDRKVGRVFPLFPMLKKTLEAQRDHVKAIAKKENKIIQSVFVRPDGAKIVSCKKAVRAAFRKAGLPNMLPHDFRRSAVRNLERAGVPRSIAKKMVGHKTDSVYERYAIVDQGMIDIGSDKLSAFLEREPTKREGVEAIADAK